MVNGLELFRDRFRAFEGAFTLIGGAACDEWFTTLGLSFRATKDLDMVLMVEAIDQRFVAALRVFVSEGGYEIRERSDGTPVLYRFAKPVDRRFPHMLELFSRSPDGLDLADGQEVIPVSLGADHHSLSAILLDDDYYRLIQTGNDLRDGLRFANTTALIPLKSKAWLDLTRRKVAGEAVDSKNITKHRNDVFRLAATLPTEPGPTLPSAITSDLASFLAALPAASEEWPSILASLKESIGAFRVESLRNAIQTYFRLPIE
jgi:hypothetical protein